jgi:molybdate-binding protein/DNA-binding XRE family transcriptional regulator
MKRAGSFENDVRARRDLRAWSQEDLSRQSGVSRAGISAIETGRLVPSAAAALALAAALECCVEDLFHLGPRGGTKVAWAWAPRNVPSRYWEAETGGILRLYPTEATALGLVPHDGVSSGGIRRAGTGALAERTLVMACCDPAVGLLAEALARTAGVRLVPLLRSSRTALTLLGQGLVHVAGVHLTKVGHPSGNIGIVRRELGTGYTLLRSARWDEGIAFAAGLGLTSLRTVTGSHLRWIGREPGSAARECLDELLGDRRPPRRIASDHRAVAEAVRNGWADVGICLRLVSEEAGLGFIRVRQEVYDLCFPQRWEADPRIRALVEVVRSPAYRKAQGELPGYQSADSGELRTTG